MTLILSALTTDYVVQVSDRRLTDLDTGKPLDETANKAVLSCGHVCFGYTGLAKIAGAPTDRWLAERLVSVGSTQAALERVRLEATEALARVPPGRRRHAFIGAGWSRSRPILTAISNFIDAFGRVSPQARATFSIHTVALGNRDPLHLHSAGQPMSGRSTKALERAARQVSTRAGPTEMVRLLVSQVREVAAANDRVGDDVMVAVIPRQAVPVSTIVLQSFPSAERAAFFYLPSPGDDTPRFYTPLLACGGLAVGGGEVWVGAEPPWWKT